MELLSYILFALALNLDSFGAGVVYGARQIRIPLISLVIISLISVAAVSASMLGGQMLLTLIPPSIAHRIGGIILLLTGLWVLQQARRDRPREQPEITPENRAPGMIEIRIRPLGLAVQILREPDRADLDSSGTISPREAVFLGTALAIDAFGAGFAVSLLGLSIGITAMVVGLGHFLLTNLGILAGRFVTNSSMRSRLTALPGCILISLGLLKIY